MTVLAALAAWLLLSPVAALFLCRPFRERPTIVPDAPEPYAYVFLHGPRDGEVTDDLSVLDTAPGPAGQYGPSGRAIVTAPGERRHALQWYPAPGGHRNPPRCVEACSAGCPAVGLAGA